MRRGLSGEVLRRIEAKGFALGPSRAPHGDPQGRPSPTTTPSTRATSAHGPLVEFMLSGPVLAVVIEGERCIEGLRSLAGATDPTVAAPDTISGDLGRDWGLAVQQNLVHSPDSGESAAREIGIWFSDL